MYKYWPEHTHLIIIQVLNTFSEVIETYSHGDLLTTFSAPCPHILFTEAIGLNTTGTFDLDKFNAIYLPGDHRYDIKELTPYTPEAPSAENE